MISKSDLIPAVASAITAPQSTAARSSGSRATDTRILARNDRMISAKRAGLTVGPPGPVSQPVGRAVMPGCVA